MEPTEHTLTQLLHIWLFRYMPVFLNILIFTSDYVFKILNIENPTQNPKWLTSCQADLGCLRKSSEHSLDISPFLCVDMVNLMSSIYASNIPGLPSHHGAYWWKTGW